MDVEAPALGQCVKVEIHLRAPEQCANYPGETTAWLVMTGKVVELMSPTRVKVQMTPTTDRYPRILEGQWLGILELHREREFPWLLAELKPDED